MNWRVDYKKRIVRALSPVLLILFRLYFDKSHLTGRHFNPGYSGYLWCIRSIWTKNILRLGVPLPWPSSHSCIVSNPKNISFHPDDLNNFQSPGTYYQNFSGKIEIGRGTYVAPNVGIITANHRLDKLSEHLPGSDVSIGANCWIGMNAVILPGVQLGPSTIVAAGAVVTKSFPDGYAVIGGIPARILKKLVC